jgi:CheY-like chemotaxis protein
LAHEINNPLEVITNTMPLLEDFVRRLATEDQMAIESERFETLESELAKIQQIVNRVQELAAGGEYGTRQYLPGTLMTDLRKGNAPPAKDGVSGADSAEVAAPGASGDRKDEPSLAGLEILVVDDDLGVCQSLAELLRFQGCEVAIATAAGEALRMLVGRSFDLVLSDVVMPDMDGYDLYMELKGQRPELPVILMTGYLYDRDHVIKRSKLAGLDIGVLFKKPIDPERLKKIILARCPAQECPHGGRRDW